MDADYARALLALRRAIDRELGAVQRDEAPTDELPVAVVMLTEAREKYRLSFGNAR